MELFIDADACPVKDEVYRVAGRYCLKVSVVSNSWLRVPESPLIARVLVTEGLDRADDWIVEHAGAGDIVITADVPLAARCLKRGARVIAPDGGPFGEASTGVDLATGNRVTEAGNAAGLRGPGRRFPRQDRARFLSMLDNTIHAVHRAGR